MIHKISGIIVVAILTIASIASAGKDVLILDDDCSDSSRSFKKRLSKHLPDDVSVKIVDAAFLQTDTWFKDTQTLIVPHTPTSELEKKLGDTGRRHIQTFVKDLNGGYIGIFGGAFLVARTTTYTNEQKLITTKERLSFAPIVASGPVPEATTPNITHPALEEIMSSSIQYNNACGHHTHDDGPDFPWCATFKDTALHAICLYEPSPPTTRGTVLLSQIALDRADDSLFVPLLRRFGLFQS